MQAIYNVSIDNDGKNYLTIYADEPSKELHSAVMEQCRLQGTFPAEVGDTEPLVVEWRKKCCYTAVVD